MVSCRWGRDCFECMHSYTNKMLAFTSAHVYTYSSSCVHVCMCFLQTLHPTHQLSEMPAQAPVLSHTSYPCRVLYIYRYIYIYIYETQITLHTVLTQTKTHSLSHSDTNGHIIHTLYHIVMWKGSIFHWPLCHQTVILSQGQQPSAGGLGRERQLKSSNSVHVNTHSCTAHARTYTRHGREHNGLCWVKDTTGHSQWLWKNTPCASHSQ